VAFLNTVQNVQRSIIPFLFVRPPLDELGECGSFCVVPTRIME
jgi:hypothetical protein